jgi:hypothetical protein
MGESRARALMVASAMPATSGNGLAMRIGLFFEALARQYRVDLVVAPVAVPIAEEDLRRAEQLAERALILDVGDPRHALWLDSQRDRPGCAPRGVPAIRQTQSRHALGGAAHARCHEMIGTADYRVIHVNRSYCAPLALALARTLGQSTPPVLTMDLDEDDSAAYEALAKLQAQLGQTYEARWNAIEAQVYA